MANISVFASGNGSNFQAIAEKIKDTRHCICSCICDQKDAYVLTRARDLSIPSYIIDYSKRKRKETEEEIISILEKQNIDIVCFAGFMRIITPFFINKYPKRIINIHPSLLPKYPGTRGIQESFESGDREIGITIHWVDEGVDTGEIILQKKCIRTSEDTLESAEMKIHHLEHTYYPEVIMQIVNKIDNRNKILQSWREN